MLMHSRPLRCLSLVATGVLMLVPAAALAQRGSGHAAGGGGRGGGGYRGGAGYYAGGGYNHGGYPGGSYGGRGYYGGRDHRDGDHRGWGYGGFGWGYGWGYPFYAGYPGYLWDDWYDRGFPPTHYGQGLNTLDNYIDAPELPPVDNTVHILVRVPDQARVWFEGHPTQQTGSVREFESPPLPPGQPFAYNVRAEWQQDGRTVTQTRRILVSAGQRLRVDFLQPRAGQPPAVQ